MIVMCADDDIAARLQRPIDAPNSHSRPVPRRTAAHAERERVLVRCAESTNSGCLESIHDKGAGLLAPAVPVRRPCMPSDDKTLRSSNSRALSMTALFGA